MSGTKTLSLVCAGAVFLMGCATALPQYEPTLPGKKFCHDLAKQSDRDSITYLTTGILFTIAAAGLVVAGTAMGPDTSPTANWAQINRNSLTVAGGSLLVLPATLLLLRSQAASEASAAAGSAMGVMGDDDARGKCLEIRAKSIRARDQIAANAQNKLTEIKKNIDELKAQLDTKKANLDSAQKAAEQANQESIRSPEDTNKKEEAARAAQAVEEAKTQVELKKQEIKELGRSLDLDIR